VRRARCPYRLAVRDVGVGRAGERIHHVRPDEIARAVVSVAKDGDLRARLGTTGRRR
jgi:hypothetical protein